MKSNKCIICEEPRTSLSPFLCSVCIPMYSPYVHTQWFRELVKLQKRQFQIDRLESATFEEWAQAPPQFSYGSSKSRGRPRKSITIEAYIRANYVEGISIRKMTDLCYSRGLAVSRETVRSIINKIRLTNN